LSVAQAMNDSALRASLEHVWESEVLPVFDALGDGEGARRYCAQVRERFLNPFLHHRLADIAQNHAEKKRRRMLPLLGLARSSGRAIEQPQLRALLDQSQA
jgi:tagaturonate reductase